MFPPRRRAKIDFGDPKFGVSPDTPKFIGRRVDRNGRSIPDADPVKSLQQYLKGRKTDSARLLAMKAIILIEPPELLRTVVWSVR